jgi:hypothetical protein
MRASRPIRVALLAALSLAAVGIALAAAAAGTHRWARDRLPRILLADPTPEALRRAGWTVDAGAGAGEREGIVVVEVDPGAVATGFVGLKESDRLLQVLTSGDREDRRFSDPIRSVAAFKALLAEALGRDVWAGVVVLRRVGPRGKPAEFQRDLCLSRFERWLYLP